MFHYAPLNKFQSMLEELNSGWYFYQLSRMHYFCQYQLHANGLFWKILIFGKCCIDRVIKSFRFYKFRLFLCDVYLSIYNFTESAFWIVVIVHYIAGKRIARNGTIVNTVLNLLTDNEKFNENVGTTNRICAKKFKQWRCCF